MISMPSSDGDLSIAVMSLNLRFGLADDGANNWVHRQKAYAPLLNAFCMDFYGFQEANDFQVGFLATHLPDYAPIGQRRPAPERWQSNVIFHHKRWRCVYHEHFFLSTTPCKPSRFRHSRWPRQCTLGVFQCCRHQLVVVNTHFDFAAEVQIRSAELIRKRLRRHARKGPVILMGDFNATPASPCYAVFTSSNRGDGRPVLRNAFDAPYMGTHHGFTGKSETDPIDWILYCGSLRVDQTVVVTQPFSGRYPSDHFPLVAHFTKQ
jgi:endonuclease/exonuclease/phosphatase family metal-dependent hydrolase